MHCVTLRLGHTWSIELVATTRNSPSYIQSIFVTMDHAYNNYTAYAIKGAGTAARQIN